jgi:translation initiation factor IF-3
VEARKNAKDKKLKEIALKLKDHEIPYRKVQVTSPEGLSDFRTLEDVLAEVERLNSGDEEGGNSFKRYHALLVANDPHPIVKIVDFKLEFRKQKAAQEKAKNNAVNRVRKEVQLTWASSEADVETKLQKMKEDLEKGFKVDLVIMPKKNVRPPRREDMQGRADDVVAHFSDVAKEWKERDYTRTTVILYLQGTSSSPSGAADEERDHKPKKQLIKEQRRQKEEERLKKKQELEARSRSNFSEENDFLTP